jgi:hypothetical protein
MARQMMLNAAIKLLAISAYFWVKLEIRRG